MRIPPPPMPAGFAFPFGAALGVLALAAATAVGTTGQPVLALPAMVAVVDTVAAMSDLRATLGTVAVCWALHAGFTLGRHGELAFTPRSAGDAAVLVLSGIIAAGVASVVRAARAAPRVSVPRQRQARAVAPAPSRTTAGPGLSGT